MKSPLESQSKRSVVRRGVLALVVIALAGASSLVAGPFSACGCYESTGIWCGFCWEFETFGHQVCAQRLMVCEDCRTGEILVSIVLESQCQPYFF